MLLLLLASCDEVERHRMLTFFFDGVPPLQTEASKAEPLNLKPGKASDIAPTGGWHIHPPVKNCTDCHGEQRRMTSSRKVELVADVPQLCYKCHTDYATLEGWVHGPVATGNCLLCHEPHKTKPEFLLRKPVPELCYQCHELGAIRVLKGHAEESYTRCTDCHDGHAGATRSLLRQTFLEKPAGLEYQSEVYRRKYEESLRKARSDLARGQDFLAVSRTIIDQIEAGQLWSARAYLEVLLNSDLLTDSEKPLVSDILQQVIALLGARPVDTQTEPQAQGTPDAAVQTPAAALRAVRDQRRERERGVAEVYYRSIQQYHAGQLAEAREGFRQILNDKSLPAPMKETVQGYLERIDGALSQPKSDWRLLK